MEEFHSIKWNAKHSTYHKAMNDAEFSQEKKIKMRFPSTYLASPLIRNHVYERKSGQNNKRKYNNNIKKNENEAYTSETAKVRPVSGWGALGGAGWGGGSSWSISINAPKSSLIAFLSFFVINRIPAKPNPKRTQRLAELDAMIARKKGLGNPRSLLFPIQQKGFRQRQREKITIRVTGFEISNSEKS